MASHTTDRTFLPPADAVANKSKTESNWQETQETRHLPAVLGMRDLTVLLVLIVLFVPNILSAQSAGPAAFLYWALALFTFLLPSAFVIQWLARRFPGQGAPYFWAIRILGAKWSFLAAFCAWWPGAIAIIATAEVGIYTIQYLAPTWFTMPAEHFLVMMAVLLVSTWEFSTALLFFCAIGLCYRHKRWRRTSRGQKFLLLSMSVIGIAASFIGIWATLAASWIPTLIPDDDWLIIVAAVILVSLALGWVGSEVPRVNALLGEQRRANHREVALRGQLQEAYDQQQVLLEELDQLYREQARAAVTDAVTGLPNHRAIMSRIDEELARCQRVQSSCAMLFVDLDHFKHVNDTCGHQPGDAILCEVGRRLRTPKILTNIRLEDFVGRYGGEEFAILLTDANVGEASQAAERLRIAVAAQPCLWQAEDTQPVAPIAVTASIGVAVYQLHGVTREALIEAADRAMYVAKHEGRNRVCLADMEMAPDVLDKSALYEPLLPVATREQTKERVAVQALIAAATAHDRSTSAHAQRLTRLVEATARKLGRPEEELQLIRLGLGLLRVDG